MTIPLVLKLFTAVLCVGGFGFGVHGRKVKFPISDRSYQVPVYGTQGVQYYSTAPLYTAVPTVLIPSQVGIPAAPIANVVIPQQTEYKTAQDISTTSTLFQANAKTPVYKVVPKYRSVAAHGHKRPTSYPNYMYQAPVKAYPVVQNQKISAVDADNQFQQSAPLPVYQSTVGSPKSVEYPKKVIRIPSSSVQTYYRRLTGPVHRHLAYGPKKIYVSGYPAKGHFHYYPSKHYSYKAVPAIKYTVPAAPAPTPESPVFITTRPVQEAPQTYAYNIGQEVRFPTGQESAHPSTATDSAQTAPGDITRAIIRNPPVVNNYDATLPIKVPTKKPYQFEMNNLIKNSGLQYVQRTQESENGDVSQGQGNALLQTSYQNGHSYAILPVSSGSPVVTSPSPFDIYNLAGSNAYQTNQLVPDQDLATSKTVKVPVAVIRGVHDLRGMGISGYSTIRQDSDAAEDTRKSFTPSKRTSDWIPMSNGGASQETGTPEVSQTPARKYGPRVEEIISGKIPREFSPNLSSFKYGNGHASDENADEDDGENEGDVVTGKISYQDGHRQRKGNTYVDSIPSTASGDTSNHVVSSVIKFSR